MTFTIFSPQSGLAGAGRQTGELYDPCRWACDSHGGTRSFRTDLIEEKDGFKILADLPGVGKENIKLFVENDLLTISADPAFTSDQEEVWRERNRRSYSRSFRLTEAIDSSRLSADYRDGVLTVTLPKKEEAKPKRIDINVS